MMYGMLIRSIAYILHYEIKLSEYFDSARIFGIGYCYFISGAAGVFRNPDAAGKVSFRMKLPCNIPFALSGSGSGDLRQRPGRDRADVVLVVHVAVRPKWLPRSVSDLHGHGHARC